jgi:hypothetical protein
MAQALTSRGKCERTANGVGGFFPSQDTTRAWEGSGLADAGLSNGVACLTLSNSKYCIALEISSLPSLVAPHPIERMNRGRGQSAKGDMPPAPWQRFGCLRSGDGHLSPSEAFLK